MSCGRLPAFLLAVTFWLFAGLSPAFAELGQRATGSTAAFSACPAPSAAPETISTPCLAIVRFAETVDPAERASIVRASGAGLRFNYDVVPAAAVLVPSERSYRALANHPGVGGLVPDRPVRALAPPGACEPWPDCKNGGGDSGDSGGNETVPAGVQRVGADTVWQTGGWTGGGVTVAIVDSGLDGDHPDLAGNIVGGVTCLGDGASAACVADGGEDDHSHGTHVGGIVAAIRGNGADVVGVAPDAALESVKVLDSSGSGWDSNIIAGLDWVAGANSGADVVNMSLGRTGDCLDAVADPSGDLVRQAIQALVGLGIPVVVAAGNDRDEEVKDTVPAGCPEAIAVASTTAEDGNNKCKVLPANIVADTASYFTTDGAMDANGVGVTVSAPGATREDSTCGTIKSVGIESLAMGGGTTEKSGTSMASPHVAGIVALMLQADAGLCPAGVRDILRRTADLAGVAPYDHPYINESLDGELEGIAYAPGAVGAATSACPAP